MIEIIPNPLKDLGVKQDIEEKVKELVKRPVSGSWEETITKTIKAAIEWGYSEGFRLGWKLAEKKTVKQMRSDQRLLDQVQGKSPTATADRLLVAMVNEIKAGADIEMVADKYVRFATPELRQNFIIGLKAMAKGGEA